MLLSPVLLLFAIAVKLDSRGPVFFRQERVGRGFRPFRIFKFRTMVVDAPQRGGQITSGHDDPRITRVGRFLRRWKFDELPQFLNVVKGEMSLVGPRPEVPRYVEMFRSEYAEILTVRPGITDLASIKFRDEASLLAGSDESRSKRMFKKSCREKLALARNMSPIASFGLDLRILFRTVLRMAAADGNEKRSTRLVAPLHGCGDCLQRRRFWSFWRVCIGRCCGAWPGFLIADQPLAQVDYLVLLPGTADKGSRRMNAARRYAAGDVRGILLFDSADVARRAVRRMARPGDDVAPRLEQRGIPPAAIVMPPGDVPHDLGCCPMRFSLGLKSDPRRG